MGTDHDPSTPQFWDIRFSEERTPWDAGAVPKDLEAYLLETQARGRVLIPGCGTAYEAAAFCKAGYKVTAIDFSAVAVAAARRTLGPLEAIVHLGDFFLDDLDTGGFDVIYERAFLCSLPRHLWPLYVARVSGLLRPGGFLIGFFFFETKEGGPPFGLRPGELHELLRGGFVLEEDAEVGSSVPVFAGRERWQRWRRLEAS